MDEILENLEKGLIWDEKREEQLRWRNRKRTRRVYRIDDKNDIELMMTKTIMPMVLRMRLMIG